MQALEEKFLTSNYFLNKSRLSSSDSEGCEDSISPSKRDTTKLKALIFKQNMDILHLLEVFEEESGCEPKLNQVISGILCSYTLDDVIQIKFLDQNFDNFQVPDSNLQNFMIIEYQSSKKLPGLVQFVSNS